jgi:C4-dicarboxylate-specific signal transduction histidine kinase
VSGLALYFAFRKRRELGGEAKGLGLGGKRVIQEDLHADPDQDEVSRHLQPLPKEEQIVETSGAIWVETFKAPISDLRMQVTGTTGLARDIPERKRAEEEKRSLEKRLNRAEKMEALGALAGGVAHDLNNVRGVIVGYSELLQHSEDKSSSIKNYRSSGICLLAIPP